MIPIPRRLCTLLISAVIGAAAGSVMADSRPDITVAVAKNPSRLDPMAENSNVNARVMKNVLETLIYTDSQNNGALTPGLAEKWQLIDDKTLEFSLRQNVQCHNGETFDAEDVAFSLGPERFLGEQAPGWAIAQPYLGGLDRVEVVNAHRVRIHFKQADPLLELRFANWMSEMVCKDAFEAAGSWESWLKQPVGTGPYRLAEVKHGDYIKLEAFDQYWSDQAPAKSVTFKEVPEIAARIAGLKTGEYQIVTELTPDQFALLQDDPNTQIAGGPVRIIRVIAFDEQHPQLKNPKMRQALSYAIDRELIVDALYQGHASVPNGLQMKVFGNLYVPDHQGTPYDPDKARQLLKEAGYKGEEISYRYLQDYYTGEVNTAQILVDMWRQVGLNVKLELKENWGQIEDAPEGRGIFNWSNSAEYPDPLGQIYRLYGPEGWFQRNKTYQSDAFNQWGEQLKSTDKAKRVEAMRELLEIYERQDPPGTYLHTLPMLYGVRANLQWTPTDNPFMDLGARMLRIQG
ncbi:ABC transporter substrate-binding protein [Marinobacterium sedimentorum]|uniref:ABC transporter substrate-binding protein n=1 Tax=Marinobacterium sedimentorum TaxID=2927804 RepID=UPI0020C620C9|nr:ABC transporter substrate-binding protein [Marinobacterium sedimentorum]MCP8687511.1 ABC transporter substrate-binding protein [Marinobacterium sedimentorum]